MSRVCLNADWRMASSVELGADGAVLSSLAYDPRGWRTVELPATVLGALVESGEIRDPFFGRNLAEIPGQGPFAQNFSNHPMPADSPFCVSWWYRREFGVPREMDRSLSLQLDGINYRANVWLNGKRIADASQVVGAYRTFELDVTEHLRREGKNVLCVEVFPPKPCDLAITWVDWNPSPPDKNMGIWRDVWLCATGHVALRAPHVLTALEGRECARLTVAGDLVNRTAQAQTAVVHVDIEGRRLTKTILLRARETTRFELTPAEFPEELVVHHPRLWWPRFLGDPALYDLRVHVTVAGQISDEAQLRFGIREVKSDLTENGHARFRVNGEPLLIRGAGFATDLFLRRQPDRDRAQLEYVKAMNLNTLRFEGMLERNEFLEWCDAEGILVIAGWSCCDCWEKWDQWNEESHLVTAESLRSQVRRVRHHPCLISWWYGSDFPPPARVEKRYREVLAEEHWPNASHSSAANKPTEVSGKSGMKMEGPYEYVPPNYWLEDTARGGAFGFATEICPGPAVPPIESLKKMLPKEHLWPIDEVWNYHAGGQEFHTIRHFADALNARYGRAETVEEFAELSQLMTYETQRAMFEAYTRNKHLSTGVIQWMLSNAWPSLIWHLYDYYLRPAGGFFGTKKACEPLHVMYSYDDRSIVVTNEHAVRHTGLTVRVRALTTDLKELFADAAVVDVEAGGKTRALVVPELQGSGTTFLDLRLTLQSGEPVGTNFYWLPEKLDVLDYEKASWLYAPIRDYADLMALRHLAPTQLSVRAHAGRDSDALRVELRNPTDRLAFFVELRLCDRDGEELLPVLWSDNYVSLLPGDVCVLKASLPLQELPSDVRLEVRGMNVPRAVVVAEPRRTLGLRSGVVR
jgi:exo-1,4-beta-D-glucosaminidase